MKKKENQVLNNLQEKNNSIFIKIIVCLILAVIVFIVLLNVEKGIMSNYEKTKVVVCKKNVEKQIDITKQNIKDYFELKEIPSNLVPKEAIKDLKDIPKGITNRELVQKEVLLKNVIESKDTIIQDIENPVETSITMEKLDRAVGGTLRRGDRVDISVIDEDNEKEIIVENVFISKAMNSSGEILTKESKEAAITFNIIVSKENAKMLKEVVNNNKELTLVKLNDISY